MNKLRTLLLLCIWTLTWGTLSASGNSDNTGTLYSDDNQSLIRIQAKGEWGRIRFNFSRYMSDDELPYVLVKIDDSYYSPDGKKLDISGCEELVSQIKLVNYITTQQGFVNQVRYALGEVDLAVVNQARVSRYLTRDNKFYIDCNSEETTIEVWLINSSGETQHIKTEAKFSFFPNELLFLNKIATGDAASLSYEDKALFFLSTFFADIEEKEDGTVLTLKDGTARTDFLTMIKSEFNTDISALPDLSIFGNPVNELYVDLVKSQNQFRRAMYSHFNVKTDINTFENNEIPFPYLDITKDQFISLYENQNIYISAYLKYLFSKNKPLLSYQINNSINEPPLNTPYRYSQYEKLSSDEGKLLADSALRYLTWGVEYTPYAGSNTLDYGGFMSSVYERNKKLLNTWVQNVKSSDKKTNYFSGRIRKVNAPDTASHQEQKTHHVLSGQYSGDTFRLISRTKAHTAPQIKRIDFWTSENTAWKTGRISGVYRGTNVSVPITDEIGNKYFDGKIQKGENSLNHTLERTVGADNCPEFSLGYEFSKSENVSSLILVTGREYLSSKITDALQQNIGNYQNHTGFNLNIYVNGSNTPIAGVDEYVYCSKHKEFYRFTGNSVGAALALAHGKENNADFQDEIVYLYYVFKQQTDVSSIVIKDKTGTEKITVSELMVFPENPIKHITSKIDTLRPIKNNWTWEKLYKLGLENDPVIYPDPESSGRFMDFITKRDPVTGSIETSEEAAYLDINIKSSPYDLWFFKQISIWESGDNSMFKTGFSVLSDSAINMTEQLFFKPQTDLDNISDLYREKRITTPFSVQGNPLPYAPLGVDSPKSFNYKMLEQNRARQWFLTRYPETTENGQPITANEWQRQRFPSAPDNNIDTLLAKDSAGDIRYSDSYLSEIDLYREFGTNLYISPEKSFTYGTENMPDITDLIKYENPPVGFANSVSPFLPGYYPDAPAYVVKEHNSIYSADKVAGADSLGLLMGAVSMSGINGNFKNIFNTDINVELDNLYRENSFNFHAGNTNASILKRSLRMSRTDIEKLSVLVTDLRDIQWGDLLVKYQDNGEPHIGIVVYENINGDESTLEEIMEKVFVISVKKEFRVTSIGSWKGAGNTYGGFAFPGDEKSYHVRRLLKYTGTEEVLPYQNVSWELLDKSLAKVKVDLELYNDPHENNKTARWIPNTGEALEIEKISIQAEYSTGELENFVDEDQQIKILPPIDPYKEDEPSGHPVDSNIYANKGSGLEFYAENDQGRFLLAKFQRQPGGGYKTLFTGLTSDYPHDSTGDAFDDTGKPLKGFSLKVQGKDLAFVVVKPTGSEETYSRFSVRPYGTVRPGDDFLLQFGLLRNDALRGSSEKKDLIGVYDKKALWRGNLFISNNNDWNDVHTWDDSKDWIAENEWNIDRIDYNVNQNREEKGNGTQIIDIHSFSNILYKDHDIHNAVAYGFPENDTTSNCRDTPFEFNSKMEVQRKLLGYKYNEHGVEFKIPKNKWTEQHTTIDTMSEEFYVTNVQDLPPDISFTDKDSLMSIKSWDRTTAPGSNWDNYDKNPVQNIDLYLPGLGLIRRGSYFENSAVAPSQEFKQTLFTLPAGKTYAHYNNGQQYWADRSAGLDCVGFAQNSAGASGNRWPDVNIDRTYPYTVEDSLLRGTDSKYYSYLIAGKSNSVMDDRGATYLQVGDINLIKPGDIMYYTGLPSNSISGYHIMVVESVELDENGNINIENVSIIESTFHRGDKIAHVQRGIPMRNYTEGQMHWRVVRLRR